MGNVQKRAGPAPCATTWLCPSQIVPFYCSFCPCAGQLPLNASSEMRAFASPVLDLQSITYLAAVLKFRNFIISFNAAELVSDRGAELKKWPGAARLSTLRNMVSEWTRRSSDRRNT
jgi:hypothetical protein